MTPARFAPVVAAVVAGVVSAVLTGCTVAGSASPAETDPEWAMTTAAAPAVEDAAEAPAAQAVDACSLVSKQEAEMVAGTPLDDPVAARESCFYTAPPTGPTAQVEVYVGDGAKKILDIDRELGHDVQPVAGAGDEAYAEDGSVFVQASGVWVSVRVVRLDDPANYRTALEDLARVVAGRI